MQSHSRVLDRLLSSAKLPDTVRAQLMRFAQGDDFDQSRCFRKLVETAFNDEQTMNILLDVYSEFYGSAEDFVRTYAKLRNMSQSAVLIPLFEVLCISPEGFLRKESTRLREALRVDHCLAVRVQQHLSSRFDYSLEITSA